MNMEDSLKSVVFADEEEKLAQTLANKIFCDAINSKATDVHIEPKQLDTVVRYRIDGFMKEISRHSHASMGSVMKVIKKMACLDIENVEIPQDGKILVSFGKFDDNSKRFDLRVSTFPTHFGEKIVLRLLNARNLEFYKSGFEKLDFSEEQAEIIKGMLKKPYGLVVFSGPSGSGKTTTCYTSLAFIVEETKGSCNIYSFETPVEVIIDGVIQTTVDPEGQFNYSRALKSVLRQDPDIVFCAEIPDPTTGPPLMELALTGHLVLTQVDASDVSHAIKRLIDKGVEPYLMNSCVEGVISQRLARRICPDCKTKGENKIEVIEKLVDNAEELEKLRFTYRGTGCEKCHNTGYRGRTAIYEILPRDERLSEIIGANPPVEVFRKELKKLGYPSLRDNGLNKAIEGITTIEEVLRATVTDY
jgi:type II secretory ATPase GspE/PulE/Tfp pilus assembly ATPase PilB-like protein